jgi:protein-disulfide isomerase
MRRQEEPLDITRIGYNQGSPDAPVKVIELSDFGCGYCMRFHTETYPTLREEYVEAGLVEWKFIPFVLGMFPNGMEAAEAAECAGAQEAFQPMKRRLFQDQRAWRDASDPTEFFTRLAREEGLDADRFRECLRRDLRMDRVRENIRLGREMGVRGTPNFVVAGVPLRGALPLATFREILDLVLKERGLTPPEH